jgi:DNA-binding IclR family transcriptional regulator
MCAYITMRDETASHPKQPAETREQTPYVIASALRTLHVLRAFAEPPHKLGLAEVVGKLGMERNQAYRSLKTLEAAGFLVAGDNARFELGSAASEIAGAVTRFESGSLVEVAAAQLDSLSATTRETVHLFMRMGDRVVCVDRRESPQSVRLVTVLGRSLPLHAGAVPKAVLAFLSPSEQAQVIERLTELPHYTERTTTDPSRLRRELAQIAERGYSISDEDFDSSARGVGAPVFSADGLVVGGISVGGPSFRVNDETLAEFALLVRAAAEETTRRLVLTGRN